MPVYEYWILILKIKLAFLKRGLLIGNGVLGCLLLKYQNF